MFPQDVDHDALVLNMFTTATEDLKLLKGVIHIMETAASKSAATTPLSHAKDKSGVYGNNAAKFLGVLHALHGDKNQARENVAIALSLLGQPDLVTEALCFEIKDIVDKDSEDKQKLLDMVTKLAKETVKVVRIQVSDVWEQHQGMEAAKAHVDAHMAAAQKANVPEPGPMVAHRLLQTRLSDLVQFHTPKRNSRDFRWVIECDGRTPDGKMCKNERDFEKGLYHCTYCSSRDFCRDCLEHLRDPKSDLITVCNPKHRCVKAVDGDDQVLMAVYAEDGVGEEVEVEAWNERIARERGIALDEKMNNGEEE
ncbi:hypothetical protein F4809DRAFT_646822 [Biscogniauxia mediterranea]|nr:hypothetical protein F4809DRAFT_646822 [Biscogniauxia mediterranea]